MCIVAAVLAAAGIQAQSPSEPPRRYAGVKALDIIANLGRVSIDAWAQADVQIEVRRSENVRVEIKSGSTLEIREHRPPRAPLERVDYVMRVPAATVIRLWSDSAAVTIRGVRGDIDVQGQHGPIDVADAGTVRLNSTTGNLSLASAMGAATMESTAGAIQATDVRGNLVAETVGGAVTLAGLAGQSVRVTTTGAPIEVAGTPRPGGIYDLASQAGPIVLRLPAAIDARISYGSVRGQFRSNLPQDGAARAEDGRTTFVVGGGSARIDLMTFSGDIAVLREPQ
jgi:hypothetical protein